MALSGQDVLDWANPSSEGWRAWRNNKVTSKCVASQRTPERVIFTISGVTQAPESWASDIRAAVATIRSKLPYGPQIVLQPVVGGPDHQVCYAYDKVGQLGPVRASVNHPDIDRGIALVVAGDPTLVAGMSPEVTDCGQYRDTKGHLNPGGNAVAGPLIADYYE